MGRLHELLPAVVAPVTSAEEVAHVLRTTRAAGTPVAVRGSGHSFGLQGLSDGGVLIVGEPGDPGVRLRDEGTAEVSARAPWHAAEQALNARGRSIPVLTNHLTVSIGGTLSVGGYGEGTIRYGGQVDLVERFRLILPDGQARWCSPVESPELFRYGIGSLGQLGVLDRVVLRSVDYQRHTTIATRRHPSTDRPGRQHRVAGRGAAVAGRPLLRPALRGRLHRHVRDAGRRPTAAATAPTDRDPRRGRLAVAVHAGVPA